MKILFTLILLLQFTNSKAQLIDHLEPNDATFLTWNPEFKVDQTKKLMSDFDSTYQPAVRLVIIPLDSLSTEKALEISSVDSVGVNNTIFYREFSKDYKNILKRNKKIPSETTAIYIELFKEVLKDTKYNNTEQIYNGNDVDYAFPSKTYYFYEASTNRSGKTVYPTKGKRLSELIYLCEGLIDYVNDRITFEDLEEQLRNRKILLTDDEKNNK
jgi:hypothetical protein